MTKIMGVLNCTPDSFYDGGRFSSLDKAVRQAEMMINDGADIIDVGGESTRPGAKEISAQEEMDRVIPVIEKISVYNTEISIDTTKSSVAEAAVRAGAVIINDISAFTYDEKMVKIAAKYQTKCILGHVRGRPENMQNDTSYNNLIKDIKKYLKNQISLAETDGIKKNNIIIDPGIGFGKSLSDNYMIIRNIDKLKKMGHPVLIGLSRKSLIGKVLGEGVDRLPATIALNTLSIINGADIIRVHDVKEHKLILPALEIYLRNC